jgi:hypothetical protein
MKTNIKFYCIYQYFMSINSFFNTVSVSRYSRPITVTRDPYCVCVFTTYLCNYYYYYIHPFHNNIITNSDTDLKRKFLL